MFYVTLRHCVSSARSLQNIYLSSSKSPSSRCHPCPPSPQLFSVSGFVLCSLQVVDLPGAGPFGMSPKAVSCVPWCSSSVSLFIPRLQGDYLVLAPENPVPHSVTLCRACYMGWKARADGDPSLYAICMRCQLFSVCAVSTQGHVSLLLFVQDEYCFYNGKSHWEPSVRTARRFVPFAVCVVSRFPYYNSLKDCLSW